MIIAKNISYGYSRLTVYEESNFSIIKGELVGLVGPNGAGKSTLFKLLKGEEHTATGLLEIRGKVGYVPQEVKHDPELESAVDIQSYIDPEMKKEMYELMIMLESLEVNAELDSKPKILSGGQRTKLAILRAIIQEPDILLLDEPTNFLDTEGKRWIMEFLSDYPNTLIVISHDINLLDQHIDKIIAINPHTKRIEEYKGNYSKYVKLKGNNDAMLKKKFENDQKEISRMKKSLQNMASGATKKGARARANVQTRIDRIKDKLPELPKEIKDIKFTLPDPQRTSEIPLQAKNISISFEGDTILSDVSLSIKRGERIALYGPNGAGKSTFIKILMGRLHPDTGEIICDPQLHIGYYSQEFETFDFTKTIIEMVEEHCNLPMSQILPILGSFNFQRQRIYQKVGTLSGGEKTRLSIAMLMLQNYNLLILDEPTTYLDMVSQRTILEALKSYKGAMLFVSHTEEFVEGLSPSRIMLLPENKIKYWIPKDISNFSD
ncbi:MAG TPA: ABC-F family ATP-binding cassette domain-containing protein [Candidatus Sulfotelmatobacter sp.]|jgi:ATP-binding cassette subfamily F protein 3|nr:ABC-F family ATP-binding cassette domain-containing protein [Candidatus Sulfotelmatobacter sp.]